MNDYICLIRYTNNISILPKCIIDICLCIIPLRIADIGNIELKFYMYFGDKPGPYYLLKHLTEDTRVLLALYGIQLIELSDDASEYICVNRFDQIYHAYTKIWKKI